MPAGPTQLRGAWSNPVLAVFVQMGGDLKKIICVPIHEADAAAAGALAETLASFKAVDAGAAGCRDTRHKQQILGIIESAFGELRAFNKLVKGILVQANTGGRRRSSALVGKRRPSEELATQGELEA